PLALALDFLSLALAETGSISERRVFRLLSPRMSFGLPRNLTGGEAGLNSGLMMAQYTAAQLVSENKILAHPASVDSIPTSDNQEDHVSMGLIAARKARQVLKNVQNLLAIEYLAATQALHLSAAGESVSFQKFPLGAGTAVAFHHVVASGKARAVNFGLMQEDEFLHAKIAAMNQLCASGEIVAKIEERLTLEV
ncbi:MAG: histidine ammonia-lyase, partial [Calditrichaeota bacterium]